MAAISTVSAPPTPRYSPVVKTSMIFVAIATVCLWFADISIITLDPWSEMKRMAWGVVTPNFAGVVGLGMVILQTIAFALCGVVLAAVAGFLLAQVFHLGPVRWICASVRAVHEIFWALIFLQMLGLSPLTGVLAIAIPYAGICAKVYAETLEEAELPVLRVLPPGTGIVSAFFFARSEVHGGIERTESKHHDHDEGQYGSQNGAAGFGCRSDVFTLDADRSRGSFRKRLLSDAFT